MRITAFIALALTGACLQACATSSREESAPNAAVFRRGEGIEFYDFRLLASHTGSHAAARVRDCSTEAFYCYSGVSVLIAPRRCSELRRLVRRAADWHVNEAVSARFLFASEDQLYFSSDSTDRDPVWRSNGGAGFVYDIERGIVGVWHSRAATQSPLVRTAMREIVDSTRWLESPAALFACR